MKIFVVLELYLGGQKRRLEFARGKVFEEDLVFLEALDNFNHLSDPYDSGVFLRIILFFEVDVFGQHYLAFFGVTLDPMVDIS